jgi:hypothetical protein
MGQGEQGMSILIIEAPKGASLELAQEDKG